ncbi:SAM-dependent DNA methyltransferase [Candidatus Poribacteria bacterium]|nr:SAM-dependent DNA methyltransferase [Candidatus Poribacteria bacterium]
MTDIVGKLWGFCHTLRHDGIDYGDYIEQITYLLFLKMADEKEIVLPEGCDWQSLREKAGTELREHYEDMLRMLGNTPGVLSDIFAGAMSRFQNPVNLKKLVNLIDEVEWTALGVDVKAQAYEGLLEKAASEGKKGAGQYFTPRILIKSIVKVMKPDPRIHGEFTISDPACGTGGFLVAAYEWLVEGTQGFFSREDAERILKRTYYGTELVPRPRRLALMNLFLHGIEGNIHLGDSLYEPDQGLKFDVVLTNPPFGTRGADQAPERDDFMVRTSNKQLNFVQHVMTILKPGGRAAIVLPDNCLFGEQAAQVFEFLVQDCDLHTILRLPKGTFTPYSPGVKANVIFFTKGRPTENVWIYDARSNIPSITKKERPLTSEHFVEFEACYGNIPSVFSIKALEHREEKAQKVERFRKFHISEVKERNYNLDIFWLKDESLEDAENLPEPEDLVSDAITHLESAVDDLQEILRFLENE